MELMKKDELQILTYKTWDLHGKINEKINQHGFSFCTFCSNHGRYCVIAESSMEEKEKMAAIRDSLKDVHNILIHLQRVKSCQKRERDEAIARLQERRKILTEMINKCSEKERKNDVLEEIMKFIGDGKSEFSWNFKGKQENVNGISRFIAKTTRFAFEFLVMFASIYSTVKYCQSRQQNREGIAADDSRMTEEIEFLLNDSKNIHFDVLHGRG